jgi:transcriptional regulator with XRE-family HTH domain
MAKPNGARLQALRIEADWSSAELAAMLGMRPGSLRNIEGGRGQISMADRRIHRAARLLTAALKREVTFDYLLLADGEDDGVPDTPPDQPRPQPKPERRKERGGTGPKREAERGAA